MKIALLSDSHGNLAALQAVLAEVDRQGVDQILSVRAATPAEVLERLGTGPHTAASLIICGHTLVPRVVSVPSPTGGHLITIVNPGSVGLPAYDDAHPFKHHIETGSPHARYAVAEQIAAGWRIDLRCVMYDFKSMAQLAESRQRPDWAVALRTGRVGLMTE